MRVRERANKIFSKEGGGGLRQTTLQIWKPETGEKEGEGGREKERERERRRSGERKNRTIRPY